MSAAYETERNALLAHYGLECRSLTPLSGGHIHQVWRAETSDGPRVVKLYCGADWAPAAVAPTLERQAFAAAAGHPVPEVHRTRSGAWLAPAGDGWVTLTELAQGAHLGPGAVTPAAAFGVGESLARLHRTLAALPVGSEARFIPETGAIRERTLKLLKAAEAGGEPAELDALAVTAARFRLEALQRYDVEPEIYAGQALQVVHGDYYPGNLLFGPDGTVAAILDWDFSGPRWRGLEIARAAVETARTPEGELDRARVVAFLEGYAGQESLNARGLFRLWFDYLLWSLYPLPLGYQPGAVLPHGWADLARRRHQMLVLLDRYLPALAEWATRR